MAQSFNTNLGNVAVQYAKMLHVAVTANTVKNGLQENPYFPSLYSLSNVFERLNIPNQAFSVTEEDLEQLEPPFIAYCSGQNTGKDFVLVTNITSGSVSYIAAGNKPKQLTRQDFLKQWQKLVFVAEADTASGEKDYHNKLRAENVKRRKSFLLYTGAAIILGLLMYGQLSNTASWLSATTMSITKLLGVAVTVLLLIYETDKTSSIVKNICTAGKQLNCDAVLNSKGGKIAGISWAEAGFFYFAATTLFLFWPGVPFAVKLPLLAISSTLAAAYIPFSIYYQWKVVKQWCPLCLATQAVLALELIWAIINWIQGNLQEQLQVLFAAPLTAPLGQLAAAIVVPVIAWYAVKPLLRKAKDAPANEAAYKRLLYNPEIFNGLLQQQQTAPDGWQTLGIDIGNPAATTTIIKVCNPYCGPCAKAHPVLEEIVKHNKDVKVKVIFTATNAENNKANKPVKHLLAIAANNDEQFTEKALDDWYLADKKEYEVFAAKYPMNGELKQQEGKIDLMKKWCDDAEITATPTIFINGKRLPETYGINELKSIF